MNNQNTRNMELSESNRKTIYKIGGMAALLTVVVAFGEMVITFPARRKCTSRNGIRLVHSTSRQLVYGTQKPGASEYCHVYSWNSYVFRPLYSPLERK